ncbi:MAG TPA: ABC transporter ATP-binding protein, partial [candidate division Zixibacteria bacterium]|nr:ABC transporter ATP-binding protein [candidate division Zixibacteria bacterium]
MVRRAMPVEKHSNNIQPELLMSEEAIQNQSRPATDAPVVQARNLTKRFKTAEGELTVLDNLNLTVQPGEMVAITGESGVGKSTLLHLLGGLDSPTTGEILCDGAALQTMSEDQRSRFRNRHIGFVFQFHHLLEDFTALENVMLPALAAGREVSQAETEALALLEQVGLAARKTHIPAELSGGEQQRVAVARALVN